MLNFEHLQFQKLAVHRVGNKAKEEGVFASNQLHPLHDDALHEVLFNYFLTHFKVEDQYYFSHQADVRMNDMYTYCKSIFDEPDHFLQVSKHILQHLYNASDHPRIKSGELYVVYFSDCLIDDELVDAIGIFKSEQKNTFIQLDEASGALKISYYEGINTKKLDKGCLVFNTLDDEGYLVKIIDSLAGENDEAAFWRHQFLGVKPVEDSIYATKTFMHMAKSFVEDVAGPEKEMGRSEQLDLIGKSVKFFEDNEDFEMNRFAETVINEPALNEQLRDYKQQYEKANNVTIDEQFDIAPNTVKREKKKFKQVINLDNSIQIKLNAEHQTRNNQVLERGFDEERGMFYYKIYYDNEG